MGGVTFWWGWWFGRWRCGAFDPFDPFDPFDRLRAGRLRADGLRAGRSGPGVACHLPVERVGWRRMLLRRRVRQAD